MEGKENIPIVFLTGVADRGRITEVANLRPQGYLLKPIDRDSLLVKTQQLIGCSKGIGPHIEFYKL